MPYIPEISCILPVYNDAENIRNSMQSILDQTFENFELIVINDGSTDETQKILESIKDPRIVLIHFEENQGLVRALNAGIARARGEFIARMDSDDYCYPERFEKQLAVLRENPTIAMVGSLCRIQVLPGGEIIHFRSPLEDAEIRKVMCWRNPIVHSSVMIRKNAVLEADGYSEEFHIGEDYHLWFKVMKNYPAVILEDELIIRKLRTNSIYRTKKHRHYYYNLKVLVHALRNGWDDKRIYLGIARSVSRYFLFRLINQ